MVKNAIQTVGIHFKVSPELKQETEKALVQESKGLSEFLRDCMFQKVQEYKKQD